MAGRQDRAIGKGKRIVHVEIAVAVGSFGDSFSYHMTHGTAASFLNA